MTVSEIFKQLSAHMRKGCVTHEALAEYYDFLALKGFHQCHEYHLMDEKCGYRKFCHYYVQHYNQILKHQQVDPSTIIPASWYNHSRKDVDIILKRESVKTGFEVWIKWQKETKQFYERMYKELVEIGQVAAALFLSQYICDVTKELRKAEEEYLKYMALDFKIQPILDEQQRIYKKYKKKTCSI